MKKMIATVLIALMVLPSVTAADAAKVLRFEMTESSKETPTEVKVRVPLSLVAVFSDKIDQAISEVEMNDTNFDFQTVWTEIRNAGPNELVEFKNEDTYVKVATTETHVKVEATGNGENITASFPLVLGDLVFSNGTLNTEDLLNELAQMTGQDLLIVEGDNISARAWVE